MQPAVYFCDLRDFMLDPDMFLDPAVQAQRRYERGWDAIWGQKHCACVAAIYGIGRVSIDRNPEWIHRALWGYGGLTADGLCPRCHGTGRS